MKSHRISSHKDGKGWSFVTPHFIIRVMHIVQIRIIRLHIPMHTRSVSAHRDKAHHSAEKHHSSDRFSLGLLAFLLSFSSQ